MIPAHRGGFAPHLHVFGYGSLVAPESVSRSLGRPVDAAELPIALLHQHRRDWEIKIPVVFDDETRCDALFLDVAPRPGSFVNGVLVPVTEREFAVLRTREAQYDAVDVTDLVEVVDDAAAAPAPQRVIVFRGMAEHRRPSAAGVTAVVPERYRQMVDAAVATRGHAFVEQFAATTEAPSAPVKAGTYRFANAAQEAATRPGGV